MAALVLGQAKPGGHWVQEVELLSEYIPLPQDIVVATVVEGQALQINHLCSMQQRFC